MGEGRELECYFESKGLALFSAKKIVLISKDLQLTFQVVSLINPELKERGHHEMEEVESPFCGIGVRPRCSCDPIARSASAESLREPAGTGVPGCEGGSPWLKPSFDSA